MYFLFLQACSTIQKWKIFKLFAPDFFLLESSFEFSFLNFCCQSLSLVKLVGDCQIIDGNTEIKKFQIDSKCFKRYKSTIPLAFPIAKKPDSGENET